MFILLNNSAELLFWILKSRLLRFRVGTTTLEVFQLEVPTGNSEYPISEYKLNAPRTWQYSGSPGAGLKTYGLLRTAQYKGFSHLK